MIRTLLSQTIVTATLDRAVAAWENDLGWRAARGGPVEADLARLLGVDPAEYPRFVLMESPGSAWGKIRLLEGPADDTHPDRYREGIFNAELACADVDALHARLSRSADFRPLGNPSTYDMRETGAAVARSFAARGPGGAAVFFTTLLEVPPPRTLPVYPHLVCPMFNSGIATNDRAASERFYRDMLGMTLRFDMRLAQPAANAVLGFPDDVVFQMVVFAAADHGIVEIDVHEHPIPPRSANGVLTPGNSFFTLETDDFDDTLKRAETVIRSGPVAVGAPPYDGRRAALLVGPSGETIELLEAQS